MTETVSDDQLKTLIKWHNGDGTRRGELTTEALRELETSRALLSTLKAERDGKQLVIDALTTESASWRRVAEQCEAEKQAAEAERDALLADSTDKAQAWDAIAEKNATIAALKSDLTRYIDIATKEATEAESLRAERDALAKALEPGFMTAVSDGQAGRYEVVIKFRDLRSMQDAHNALVRSTLKGDAP